jgi:hypothetical protein
MIEMRLVEIAACECDVCQIRVLDSVKGLEYFSKPLDSRIQFGRQSDFIAKNLNESTCAEPNLFCDFSNGLRLFRVSELL